MSIVGYPFPESFPPDKLKRLVSSPDFPLFREMLMARAQARQAYLVSCEGGIDALKLIQGGIREDLWLHALDELADQIQEAQERELEANIAKMSARNDQFGERPRFHRDPLRGE